MGVKVWELFPELTRVVHEDHIKMAARRGGHDFLHTLSVAQYALIIAEEERTGELAAIAGLVHNTDRIFESHDVERKIREYLDLPNSPILGYAEKNIIVNAVMEHDKPNNSLDNDVIIILKDADRLASIGAAVLIRGGQFYNEIPAVDPRFVNQPDPSASFRNPKSVFRNTLHVLEWETWLRLPKAREIASPRFKLLKQCLEDIRNQVKETELDRYPVPIF